jgi:hypothetical protein
MILTHRKEKKEVVLIHPQPGLNEFGGIRQIYPPSCKKVFASFCRVSQSDAYVFLRCMPAGWNDRLASPKAVRGGRNHAVLSGKRAIGVIVRMPHSSTFGNQVLNRYLPNF